jgi:hypothetical protein
LIAFNVVVIHDLVEVLAGGGAPLTHVVVVLRGCVDNMGRVVAGGRALVSSSAARLQAMLSASSLTSSWE